jgi:hypothetical protein
VCSLLGSLRRVSVLVIAIQAAALADVPRDIGTRLEMFIDHYLIDRLHGTRLALSEPRPAGEALRFDSPWDGACSGFPRSFTTTAGTGCTTWGCR